MPGRRSTATAAALACALVFLALLISCSTESRRRPAVTVDHVTAAVAVARPSDRGPALGGLRLAGYVDTPLDGRSPVSTGHAVVDGQLFVATGKGLVAHDAATGTERWHYREQSRGLMFYAVTGGVALVMTGVPRDGRATAAPDRWTALDAATGRMLWTRPGSGTPLRLAFDSPQTGVAGVVPVIAGGRVHGIDARTGRERWVTGVLGDQRCQPRYGAGDAALMLVTLVCRRTARFFAIDPATGRERWRREIPAAADTLLESPVQRGVALLSAGGDRLLLTADGRELLRADRSGFCAQLCGLAVGADHAVLADDRSLHTVDLRTGEKRTRPAASPYYAVTVAGGLFYGLRRTLADPLLPAALDVIDPRTGAVRGMPMPFTLGPGSLSDAQVEALRVAGDRVFVTETYRDEDDGTRGVITSTVAPSPGRGPAALGGVPVKDWPDACALAPGYRRAGPSRDTRVGGTALRHVQCTVQGPSAPAPVKVTVLWVARSAREAEDFLPENADQAPVGDATVETDEPDRRVVMRSGRYLIAFDGGLPRVEALARTIHDRLRDH